MVADMLRVCGLVGLTLIVVLSRLFAPVRQHLHPASKHAGFLYCGQCVGFWIGAAGGLTSWMTTDGACATSCVELILLYGGSVSMLSYVIELVIIKMNGPPP